MVDPPSALDPFLTNNELYKVMKKMLILKVILLLIWKFLLFALSLIDKK